MKRIYVFVFLCLILTFVIANMGSNDGRIIVISQDVKKETKNIIKSYYISQRNELNYMPLAEDDFSQDYSMYSNKLEDEEQEVNIQIVKGDTE